MTVGCFSAHWCIQSWFHLEPDSFSSLCRKLRENCAGLWSILKALFWFSIKTVQPWACPKLCVRSMSRHSNLYTTTRTVQWLKETASSQQGGQLTPAENTGCGNKTNLESFSFMKEYVLERKCALMNSFQWTAKIFIDQIKLQNLRILSNTIHDVHDYRCTICAKYCALEVMCYK